MEGGVNVCDLFENIKRSRLELNMTKEELAEKMGYTSRSTIAKIELGVNDITQSKIIAFAKVLKTTPGYLMGWESEAEETKQHLLNKSDSKNEENFKITSEEKQVFKTYQQLTDKGKEKVKDYIDMVSTTEKRSEE